MTLKVIGAGFGRTGTMSLQAALQQLGFAPCYHMAEVFIHGPETFAQWEAASAGTPDWDAIFDGYQATVDFPACTHWKALAEYYPDAKVLLSVRDPEKWFQSTQDTIFSPPWIDYLETSMAGKFFTGSVDGYFDRRMHDKDYLVQRFRDHVADVQATIAPERLLTYQVQQGWGPLCKFLEVAEPDTEFPRINDTDATKEILSTIIENGFESTFNY